MYVGMSVMNVPVNRLEGTGDSLLLVHEDTSHTHSRANAHACHEDLSTGIFCDRVAGSDLPSTSY